MTFHQNINPHNLKGESLGHAKHVLKAQYEKLFNRRCLFLIQTVLYR